MKERKNMNIEPIQEFDHILSLFIIILSRLCTIINIVQFTVSENLCSIIIHIFTKMYWKHIIEIMFCCNSSNVTYRY